jgi:replicative DNA helicase
MGRHDGGPVVFTANVVAWGVEGHRMADDVSLHRRTGAQTVSEVLSDLDEQLRSGSDSDLRSIPTGFGILDDLLGGGPRTGELVLLGGPPGVGKTIMALQWAREVARAGGTAVYACYEHDPATLLVRLLGLEAGATGETEDAFTRDLSSLLATGGASSAGLEDVLSPHPGGLAALEAVHQYADRLVLVRASGAHTTLEELGRYVDEAKSSGRDTVLFVDYLQKVPLHPEPPNEAEKVTRTVEGLKDLALEHAVPVVLLSAVDAEGMRANRLRMYHLRGSSAIAFESDVVLMMNSKEKAVSKIHLSYDPVRARRFRDWVVVSVEKNRGGPNLIDLEFCKDFRHFRFDPEGGLVSEKLVDERSDEHEL